MLAEAHRRGVGSDASHDALALQALTLQTLDCGGDRILEHWRTVFWANQSGEVLQTLDLLAAMVEAGANAAALDRLAGEGGLHEVAARLIGEAARLQQVHHAGSDEARCALETVRDHLRALAADS